MRASLLMVVVLVALPYPASARMSLARAAAAICASYEADDIEAANDVIDKAGARAVVPLLNVMSSERHTCLSDPWKSAVALLCDAQSKVRGNGAAPAFAPVRTALASPDWRRAAAALKIVWGLASWTPDNVEAGAVFGPSPRCENAGPMLASAADNLARLLDRTEGDRRQEVLSTIEALKLRSAGAPLVPALIRLLDENDLRERAVVLLGSVGKPAAAAAPRLGRLLAGAADLRVESHYASALGAVGAPSPAAATALPARLDEAAASVCPAPRRFVTLFRAAGASGPLPGRSSAVWENDLVSRAQSALARIGSACPEPIVERDLIVALAMLPPAPELVTLLETEMTNATAATHRRFWAAWALRHLRARLSPLGADTQTALLSPPDRPLPPVPEPDVPLRPLFNTDLVVGMTALKPKVADCYARNQVPGMAIVNVQIGYGRVMSATATGKFAGTPTGACLESAVRTGKFPVTEEMAVPLSFQLQ